jgi:hypothetical protein
VRPELVEGMLDLEFDPKQKRTPVTISA